MSEADTWKRLAEQAEQGNLTLDVDPDQMNAAIKHLQDYIDSIDGIIYKDLATITHVSGFGGFEIGVQLAQKFGQKAIGPDGIQQRLKELQDAAKNMQDAIRKAAKAYADQDHDNARNIKDAGH